MKSTKKYRNETCCEGGKKLLSARHKSQRLDFALQHQYWNIDDWKRVIWSDETKINCLGPEGLKWIWRTTNEALQERLVQGTMKYHGGNLVMWRVYDVSGSEFCLPDTRRYGF